MKANSQSILEWPKFRPTCRKGRKIPFLSIVTLTFDLDLQTRPSEDQIRLPPCESVWCKSVQRFPRYFIHKQKPQTDRAKNGTFRSSLRAVTRHTSFETESGPKHENTRLCLETPSLISREQNKINSLMIRRMFNRFDTEHMQLRQSDRRAENYDNTMHGVCPAVITMGALKTRDWKTRNWKTRHQTAGLENARTDWLWKAAQS